MNLTTTKLSDDFEDDAPRTEKRRTLLLRKQYLRNVVDATVMAWEPYHHYSRKQLREVERLDRFPIYMRPSRKKHLDKLERYDDRARFGK